MTKDQGDDDEVDDLAETDPDNGPSELYRSEDEVRTELGKLSEHDACHLLGIARNRAIGTRLDPEDLFHTSLERLLQGRRRWRKDENLAQFVARTVKNLVKDWWRREARVSITPDSFLGATDEARRDAASDSAPDALRVLMAQAELDAIKAVLNDDKKTLEVAMLIAEGEKPAEIREAYGLTQTQYDTVLTRIVRRRKNVRQKGEE